MSHDGQYHTMPSRVIALCSSKKSFFGFWKIYKFCISRGILVSCTHSCLVYVLVYQTGQKHRLISTRVVHLLIDLFFRNILYLGPGRVAQSVTCLATDACLTADPGVASSIPVRSHTFVEIDHEMISTAILLPSADSFKKGCCQLHAKVCARITG